MMRSLFSGVNGLQTHQIKMDVIGNNIANVNTHGFKSSRVTFKEVISQTLANPSAPTNNRGGINPQQVGLGVGIGSVDVIHTPGGTQPTSSATDLAIQGTGFFIVSDGSQNFYTRAGIMDFDGDGNLYSKVNGMMVMGYLADSNGHIAESGGQLRPIKITNDVRTISPEATKNVYFQGNLQGTTPADEKVSRMSTVYDSKGGVHRVIVEFTKGTNPNEWTWEAYLESDPGTRVSDGDPLVFDKSGTISGGKTGTIKFKIDGAKDLNITLDFTGVRQYDEDTSVVVAGRDGAPSGELDSLAIDQSGVIVANYTNGKRRNIAQIALARFENPGGLVRVGDTMFAESVNSGNAVIGTANVGGFGDVLSNTLEMSNVDLSEQFTDMIITQRGFQASSRIISSADEMLQELVNLKR